MSPQCPWAPDAGHGHLPTHAGPARPPGWQWQKSGVFSPAAGEHPLCPIARGGGVPCFFLSALAAVTPAPPDPGPTHLCDTPGTRRSPSHVGLGWAELPSWDPGISKAPAPSLWDGCTHPKLATPARRSQRRGGEAAPARSRRREGWAKAEPDLTTSVFIDSCKPNNKKKGPEADSGDLHASQTAQGSERLRGVAGAQPGSAAPRYPNLGGPRCQGASVNLDLLSVARYQGEMEMPCYPFPSQPE